MTPQTRTSALLADLYEFTMAAIYFKQRMFESATFSLFIRNCPPNRGYFVSAGLEEVLSFLDAFSFTAEEIEYLRSTGLFEDDFLQYLSQLRFSGNVHAIPEGSIFFSNEPVLEITAPIIEAQLVESAVMNAVNVQVTIASKATRCIFAAKGRGLMDFALRRTQGTDASLKVARTSYITGFTGTSNVLAGQMYGIPVSGTMAHSYVTSFDDEIKSFRTYAEQFPDNTILLIDTYDPLEGARKAALVGREMKDRGHRLKAVRIDSGDIVVLSRKVREILDEAGLDKTLIIASGGLDEWDIEAIIDKGGAVDGFGVGTKMGVSADAPFTDSAYKLVSYAGKPVLKLSTGKTTFVSEKQVFRHYEGDRITADTLGLRTEKLVGTPLLQPFMTGGRRTVETETLTTIRDRFQKEFAALGDRYKALTEPDEFPVTISPALSELQEQTTARVKKEQKISY